jgi:hypothetical protein
LALQGNKKERIKIIGAEVKRLCKSLSDEGLLPHFYSATLDAVSELRTLKPLAYEAIWEIAKKCKPPRVSHKSSGKLVKSAAFEPSIELVIRVTQFFSNIRVRLNSASMREAGTVAASTLARHLVTFKGPQASESSKAIFRILATYIEAPFTEELLTLRSKINQEQSATVKATKERGKEAQNLFE